MNNVTVEVDLDSFGLAVRNDLMWHYSNGQISEEEQQAFLKVIKYYSLEEDYQKFIKGESVE